MKRPLSLGGYILGIIGSIFSAILNLSIGVSVAYVLNSVKIPINEYPAIFQAWYVFVWLIMAFSIMSVIFSIICVLDTSKNPMMFRRQYPFFILSIIFNILNSLLYVVTIILFSISSLSIAEVGSEFILIDGYALPLLAFLTTSVLLIVDLIREKERRKESEGGAAKNREDLKEKPKEQRPLSMVSNDNQIKSDRLNFELVKLLEMKENSLLSEQDYNMLKKNLIENYMK